MKATLNNAKITPKKANLVAGMVRGMNVTDALTQLQYTPKKAASLIAKVIQSALANATNNFAQTQEKLFIKTLIINKGVTYKRGLPVSRGQSHPILKRNSHIMVELGVQMPSNIRTKASEVKKAPKAQETREAREAKKNPPKKTTVKKPSSPKKTAKKSTATEKKPTKKKISKSPSR